MDKDELRKKLEHIIVYALEVNEDADKAPQTIGGWQVFADIVRLKALECIELIDASMVRGHKPTSVSVDSK